MNSSQEVPRPEHPQPQFQRENWLNLNGVWEFEFDDADIGLEQGWAVRCPPFSRRIVVPFCFESPQSGIGDTGFHPQTWYRRSFRIPENWANRRVLLHFGAVDYRAAVWVNGQCAGQHEGGHTPFRFDITRFLTPGDNVLVVRAEDPPDQYIPRGKQHWELESRGIFYARTSGIWQTVWLEAVGESWFDKVRIIPHTSGLVTFEAAIARSQSDLEFTATIRHEGRILATSMSRALDSQVVASAHVRHPRLWSPDAPHLYDVTFELKDNNGEVLDCVDSYFGFRTISVQDNRVILNGRPIFLKFVLDQGYWPETNMTPPSDEAIQFDIRAALEMGFNGVRKHQKIEDPRFLYWADRLGLLVSAEMPNAYLFDEHYVRRITAEWIEAVERDFNHPSIIIWVPINESWGVPNLRDPRQRNHLRAMYALTHSIDSSRLVIDNDGWEHTEMTDLFAIHDYTRTGELSYERFKEVGKPGVPIPAFATPVLAPGCNYNGSPVYLSEFGGIAFNPPGNPIPPDSWGYSGIEPTAEAALRRIRGLYEAIEKIPGIAGLCYTQLVDVEQEINGLLTYDRKPKFDFRSVREINGLIR